MRQFGRKIPKGNIVATNAGYLPCKKVIHAVGPFSIENGFEPPIILKKTIGNCLKLTNLMGQKSIAIPTLCST
jgi:O-acetyl-ADP-ribose deacetylase (regulator of RNase III)